MNNNKINDSLQISGKTLIYLDNKKSKSLSADFYVKYKKNKFVLCPRLQQTQGKSYTFSGTTLKSNSEIDPIFNNVISYLNEELNANFNMILINWYRDGNDYIGYHSDDESQLKKNSKIVIISLGVTRDFYFKHKKTKEIIKYKLEPNSVIVMSNNCQKEFQHSLPKRTKIKDYRISITLREFREEGT